MCNNCGVIAQPSCSLTQALLLVCQATLACKGDTSFRHLHFQFYVVFMTENIYLQLYLLLNIMYFCVLFGFES